MPRNHIVFALPIVLFGGVLAALHAAAEPQPRAPHLPPAEPENFPTIEIFEVDYGGPGCPEDTASVDVTGSTVALLFDEYVASTSPGNKFERKSCNYAVVLDIPAGYRIAFSDTEYHGTASIPPGGHGRFRIEHFWAGQRGPVSSRFFPANYVGDWTKTDSADGAVWSPCGGEMIARGNTSAEVWKESPHSNPEAELAVDGAKIEFGIIYRFRWDHC